MLSKAATGESRPSHRLGTGRVIAYGAGDFAFNLSFSFCSLFLLYFYTDVLGINPSVAGLIIMAALIWEGITDPIIGVIANRTQTRWGRYRPYLLFGAVPLGLSVVAMMAPVGLTGGALVAYSFVTHLIYRTVFAAVNIPYVALSAQMTSDSDERGQLAAARMVFAILCGLTMAACTLPLSNAFGGGRIGFFVVSTVYSAIATLILLVCFRATREDVVPSADEQSAFRDVVRALPANRPFLILLGATIFGSTAYTMSGKALVYYLKYWVGSEEKVTLGLVVMLATSTIATIPWMLLSQRWSKRTVWLAGASINVAAYTLIFILAPRGGPALWGALALIGVGNAGFVLTFWSMLPDTVEYGEWRTGKRTEGAIFGLMSFAQKIAFGLGTGMIGVLLDHFDYHANRAQSARTLHGIVVLYGLGPLLLFAASIALITFYPIDRKFHRRLVAALGWRRARVTPV